MKKNLRFTLLLFVFAITFFSCKKDSNTNLQQLDEQAFEKEGSTEKQFYRYPVPHPTGVPPLTGRLEKSNIVMKSVIFADLDRNVARIPLHKAHFKNQTVWFVITDVSDHSIAKKLGLNFAPRLANAGKGCTLCVEEAITADTILGKAPVTFTGTVDFSPLRKLVPGPHGFPPSFTRAGGVGSATYSDLIRIKGARAIYNAPIVATGTGPFDVSQSHTNTHDRVVAIDTNKMTVDLQFVRAFAFGRDIFYFSFASSDEETATIERAIFVPTMANIPAPDKGRNPNTARCNLFAFANGKRGLSNPNVQGLNHVILDNASGELSNNNPALYETLRKFGDARNVLEGFTTLVDGNERFIYSPIWDAHIGMWSDKIIARNDNFAQNDATVIQQLASRGYITNPDGTPLSSTGAIINCPIMGFATKPPLRDQAPLVH